MMKNNSFIDQLPPKCYEFILSIFDNLSLKEIEILFAFIKSHSSLSDHDRAVLFAYHFPVIALKITEIWRSLYNEKE